MQELITLLESLFSETIIGSDINLVKHLFYYLKADGREFDFIYNEETSLAVVDEIYTNTLDLIVPDFKEAGQRRARIKFEIMNILYQFEVLIQDIRDSALTIRIPSELQSMQLRQSKRLPVDDLFMNFIILFRSLTGGTREVGKNLYAERRFPHLMKEIRKDKPNLKLINVMLTDYIKTVSPHFDIVLFSDHETEPDEYEKFLRKQIGSTPKTLYIPSTTRLENYIERTNDPVLTNYYQMYQKLEVEASTEDAFYFIESLQKRENRAFEVSYVYSSIRIYDEVKGYIKVFSTAMDRFTLTSSQAVFIHELAEIINYAFTKIAIQVTSYEQLIHSTKIVDISMDGLLFEIHNRKLFHYLKNHNIIKMNIPLGMERVLVLRGEIVRYIEKGDSYLLGVNFFDSNPDDMLFLENYLYEKSMNIISE